MVPPVGDRSEGEGMSDHHQSSSLEYQKVKLFNAKRLPGDGRERWSISPVRNNCNCSNLSSTWCQDCQQLQDREDSVSSVTGSMLDLVQEAREVRRLIRDASFDSLSSDWNISQYDLSPAPVPTMSTSNSAYALGGADDDDVLISDHHRPSKDFYLMTAMSMDFGDPPSSLEWESPTEGWHDLKESKYKMSIRGCVDSEFDDDGAEWEWDSEGFSLQQQSESDDIVVLENRDWFEPELDLETELKSFNSSRRQSIESNTSSRSRQPPSGRSSVDRESSCEPVSSSPQVKNVVVDLKQNVQFVPRS